MQAIALATHPANKDASAEVIASTRINGRAALIFKLDGGYLPAYCDMTCPGYMPDAVSACEWLEAYAAIDAGRPVNGANLEVSA